MFTQIGLVQRQRGLAIEFVQHIAAGTGDQAFRAKGIPAAKGAVAHPDALTIEAQRGDPARSGFIARPHQGILEAAAVPGQPAGGRHTRGQMVAQALHQLAAVDLQTIGQHQYVAQSSAIE